MIETIREFIWRKFRDAKNYKHNPEGKKLTCMIGFHNTHRGFGWSNDKRMDVCVDCFFSKWYDDKEGYEILKKEIEVIQNKKK